MDINIPVERLRDALRALRARGFTFKQMAVRLETEPHALYNFVNGRTRTLRQKEIEKLAHLVKEQLGSSGLNLLSGADPSRPSNIDTSSILNKLARVLGSSTEVLQKYAGLSAELLTSADLSQNSAGSLLKISNETIGNAASIQVRRRRKANSDLDYEGVIIDVGGILIAVATDISRRVFLAVFESVGRQDDLALFGIEIRVNEAAELSAQKCVGVRTKEGGGHESAEHSSAYGLLLPGMKENLRRLLNADDPV